MDLDRSIGPYGRGASASSDLCNETTAVKYKNTTAGKTAKKKVSDHDHPCQGMSGADLAACHAPYSAPTPKPQSTPTCSSSLCNASAPTTAAETDWSTWANAKIDWSTVGQSVCTAADPCVPGLVCSFGGCVVTPFSDPVSSGECDPGCQGQGAALGAVAVGVAGATYACAIGCATLIGSGGPFVAGNKERIEAWAQSFDNGAGAPTVAANADRIRAIIAPAGNLIGVGGDKVRTLPGGWPAAQELFRQISSGSELYKTLSNGVVMRTADGVYLTLRQWTTSGPPAITINFGGGDVVKWHFGP